MSDDSRQDRLDRALTVSEHRSGSLINYIDSAFCAIDLVYDDRGVPIDYRFIEANRAFYSHAGIDAAALGLQTLKITQALRDSWVPLFAEVARTGKSIKFDHHVSELGDSWYEVIAYALGPLHGRVAILFNEITSKRRIETALRLTDVRLKQALAIASLGTFEWDVVTERLKLSPRGREIFGFGLDAEPSAIEIKARIEPADYGRTLLEAREAAITGLRLESRYGVLQSDGSLRTVRSIGQVAEDSPSGHCIIGVLEDVTSSQEAEHVLGELNAALKRTAAETADVSEALFNEKERAQVTLNSIGDGVICTDVTGKITYLNTVAERLTGWNSTEAVGESLEVVFNIIDPHSRSRIPNPMSLATKGNKTVSLPDQCILVRRDQTEIAIADSTAPIHDRSGATTGAVMVFHDVSVARNLTIQLAHQAQHDDLTDLPNRSLLNDRLAQAIAASTRHDLPLAVLYLDIDRFKNINDSLGHLVGDHLLKEVARRLSRCVRATDTVSRQGGDEFVIVLTEVNNSVDAGSCADKILTAIRAPYSLEGHELHISASIGVVMCPADGAEVEVLLKNADSAMYEAKERGRDHYQFYRSELNATAIERQSLEQDLRYAAERQQLELYYQPIVQISSGAVAGVEALLRWAHPTRGLLGPAAFMQIAEESGLIVPIGEWVLREACRQGRTWQTQGLDDLRLAVNISAVELRSKGFVASVAKALTLSGFPSDHLELELTETFLMQDSRSTALVLGELKALKVHLALDDFGTGYSSLSYVRRFPINALKVDQSFVHDLSTDPDDASVVSAVINLGRSLNLRVVAEGVETQAQLAFLQEQGCPEAQGYFFSRPLTSTAFAKGFAQGTLWALPPIE